ncbi:hypothetical protein DMI62_02575 [Escherichia coli]|nr:hypothetical protein [Escherichia coli]
MRGCVRIIFRATVIRWSRPGRRCIRRIRKRVTARARVDFAELLLRAHELWLNKPHILQHYRERFTNIPVDEFRIPTTFSMRGSACWRAIPAK